MQIIPFESSKVPAFLRANPEVSNNMLSGSGGGFPTVSIKGKVFHISRGDERVLVQSRDADGSETGDPAASIEVIILEAGPAGANRAKVFYDSGYSEGSDARPTCFSNDGIAPSAESLAVQATKCALCPHNVWGSKITDDGRKGKACQDSKRLAVAATNALGDAMLLRVPAASLKALDAYAKLLISRGVKPHGVVTKIGFDYTVAHPQLTFKPVGFVSQETVIEAEALIESPVVRQIVGLDEYTPPTHTEDDFAPAPAPAPAPTAKTAKPVAKPKPAPVAEETGNDEDDLPQTPKAKVTVEGESKNPPVAAKPKPAAPVVVESEAVDSLDDLDFDD